MPYDASICGRKLRWSFRRHATCARGTNGLCPRFGDTQEPIYALQAMIPKLTRSSLHRCLQRHDISQLLEVDGDRPRRKKFNTYPIGYFHIDIAEVRTEQGRLPLFVAIDRTSKFAFVEVHGKATQRAAADFLNALIQAVPYTIHTVLTDNGVHFTTPGNRCSAAAEIRLALQRGEIFRAHAFEFAYAKAKIDHRLTKPKHPWTNGQVERMNRTLKEATVKRFHYETHQHFRQHLADFVNAYNFARRLKTLKGFTPFEYICSLRTLQTQPNPSISGTKQLGWGTIPHLGSRSFRAGTEQPIVPAPLDGTTAGW